MQAKSNFRVAVLSLLAFGLLWGAGTHDRALAAKPMATKLTAADKAWIDKCVADRQGEKIKASALRKYCGCMQQVVDNNEPFESITELERTYPPAHRVCKGGKPE